MIVTLAGHVDHGKTSLVRALTGVDTDRLEQEKARGLTIDLGFAYIDDGAIGFVDVPGHHKFIHNMVAGVARHQHALLVIAADDGPMPQSNEHLQILNLVGVDSGVIAMTKCDRVDTDRLAACETEIRQLVSGSFLADAPILRTSIEQPDSVEALLANLREAATRKHAPQMDGSFRMAVDRAFNVKGAGVVVTGTVHSGHVHIDDQLQHFPSSKPLRVRSIRAQDQLVETAGPGSRCALNLSGVELAEIKRGDWVGGLAPYPCREITVSLRVLDDFPRVVKHWTPVHIYHATSHSTGRLALLSEERLQPGTTSLVDLICDEPLNVRHGDQLIVRDQSLDITLGGGSVVHAQPKQTARRRQPARLDALQAYDTADAQTSLSDLLANGVVDIGTFANVWHLSGDEAEQLATGSGALRHKHLTFTADYWQALGQAALDRCKAHQEQDPSSPGLRQNAFTDLPKSLRQGVLNFLVQQKQLHNEAGHFRLPDHQAALPEALAAVWERLQTDLDHLQAPSTGDLAKSWQAPQAQLERDLKELTKRGLVTHIANHRFYLPSRLQELAAVAKRLAGDGTFNVRQFRDATGVGRNVAIEVLEYFDSRGYTRRQDNERRLLRDSL